MEKYAMAVVQYPQPVVINGSRYGLMTIYAHKKYAREIIATIRFLRGSVEPQKVGRSPHE
jgi:hypothetical protein